MEGISGITSMRQVSSTGAEYGHARLWMTEDVNAAVAGALEGGAAEVLIRDAHGTATNLLPDRLHPAARLVAGWAPQLDMLQGLDSSFATAFFIGYHPGPAAERAVLSHTYSMETIRSVEVNSIPAGETLLNAVQAGSLGIPVGLVSGERALFEEISTALPGIEFVETKIGYGYQSALCHPLEACRSGIRKAAARAVERLRRGDSPAPYRPELPVRARIEFHKAEACLATTLVPGLERIDSRSAVLLARSGEEFVRRFLLLMQVLYGLRG